MIHIGNWNKCTLGLLSVEMIQLKKTNLGVILYVYWIKIHFISEPITKLCHLFSGNSLTKFFKFSDIFKIQKPT